MVMGLGMGTAMSTSINTATLGVDPQDAGVASATVNTMQQVGGSVGTALLSSIAGTVTAASLAVAGTSPRTAGLAGYDRAFLVAAAIFLVGAVVCGSLVPAGRPHAAPAATRTGDGARELPSAAPADDSWGGPDSVPTPTPVTARTGEGGLVGRVLDGSPAGRGPVAATVTLIDASDGAQVGRARTGVDGSYSLSVPRPGDYLLVCAAPGTRPVAERVRVAATDLAISRDLWAPAG
jgi:hypothetical protein